MGLYNLDNKIVGKMYNLCYSLSDIIYLFQQLVAILAGYLVSWKLKKITEISQSKVHACCVFVAYLVNDFMKHTCCKV